MEKIGLFPLAIVLFPESIYPLHIYEDRYISLINSCIESGEQFGINLFADTRMQDVGCAAEVAEVVNIYNTGRLDILARGVKRYRLDKFSESPDGFYIADVEYFDDEAAGFDDSILVECVELFNKIAGSIEVVNIEPIDLVQLRTERPSFYIAQKAGLSIMERQEVLELRNENDRLMKILDHLKSIMPAIRKADTISRLIRNDGYQRPDFLRPKG
ncbi:MAG: LON peptidase substrate-binding domain-containing protein [Candidatus Kapaibacterium sp.]